MIAVVQDRLIFNVKKYAEVAVVHIIFIYQLIRTILGEKQYCKELPTAQENPQEIVRGKGLKTLIIH